MISGTPTDHENERAAVPPLVFPSKHCFPSPAACPTHYSLALNQCCCSFILRNGGVLGGWTHTHP